MQAKFNQLNEMVKSQIALNRLIKRNKKAREAARKAVGAKKRGPKPAAQKQMEQELVCKIPFIVVKYKKDKSQPDLLEERKVKLTSVHPLKCYGDSTILSKMKLQEMSPEEQFEDVLGPVGKTIPEAFKRIDQSIKHF